MSPRERFCTSMLFQDMPPLACAVHLQFHAVANRHRLGLDGNGLPFNAWTACGDENLPRRQRRTDRDAIDAAFGIQVEIVGGIGLAAVVAAAPNRRARRSVKSTRASSVGQRSPLASTTSTSINATSSPSACRPCGPTIGVSRICAGGPAVVSSSCATDLPSSHADCFQLPGANSTFGKGKHVSIVRLSSLAADLPLTNNSTDCVVGR